ncbi:MAG: glutathione S-transferase family protein [Proteobacteria bacterium]|jgi:glutathione S-transferase|nr:glutathione S-transferase family protein [Pseudomonadota bacterium]
MPKSIRLQYFDFHGGRGETARIALSIGNVPFTDERVKGADWPALKPSTPFGELPVLEVDGERISQSNAINRYVGQLTGLYPDDRWQAAQCDEVCCAAEALNDALGPSFSLKGDEQKRERERLLAGPIPRCLKGLENLLVRRGEWFAANRLTIADLKVVEITGMLSSGRLDHIAADIVERTAPALAAHRARVLAHPGVRAYYARFGR